MYEITYLISNLGIGKLFYPTLYTGRIYLFVLGWKLTHDSKKVQENKDLISNFAQSFCLCLCLCLCLLVCLSVSISASLSLILSLCHSLYLSPHLIFGHKHTFSTHAHKWSGYYYTPHAVISISSQHKYHSVWMRISTVKIWRIQVSLPTHRMQSLENVCIVHLK